jgi:hypothetical protein
VGSAAVAGGVILDVVTPPGLDAERDWILDVLLRERLGLPYRRRSEPRDDIAVSAADAPGGPVLLLADVLLATPELEWPSGAPQPAVTLWDAGADFPEATLVEPSVPVLFGAASAHVGPGRIRLEADLLGGAFFLLTRLEELDPPELDPHGRMPAAASVAGRAGFLERPVVDEYAEILLAALRRLFPRLEPPARDFAMVASHDVDVPLCRAGSLRTSARHAAIDVVRRRDPALAGRRLVAALTGDPRRDVCNTFEWIMAAHEERGLRGAFYFIAGGDSRHDAAYRIGDPWIRGLLRRIHERGHEVGLHPSYDSYADPGRIAGELGELRRVCEEEGIELGPVGGRQHFLRFANPDTWRAWEEAGLAYDSTLAFADRPGFRCGACFEYPVFDVPARRRLALRERPLVAMEASLLQYLALPDDEAAALLTELKRRCRLFGGSFTLLWHNDRLQSRGRRRLYLGALDA